MAYEIYYFLDHRDKNPVEEFVHSLPKDELAKFYAYIDELAREGPNLKRPMADYIGHSIYELRPKRSRIFYFFYSNDYIVLLHAIKKKTNAIPLRDLIICYKRKVIVGVFQKLKKVEKV